MAQDPQSKNEFRFILNGVRSESLRAVAQELTKLFPLDLPNAVNIAKNAPIILLDKLNAQQARVVGTYGIRLRALGAEVQVTSQPVGKLQVLRWPLLPDIAKRPGNHCICPNCGARLQMQIHVSGPEPVPTQAEAEGPAAPQPAVAAPAEASAEPAPEPLVAAAPEPAAEPEEDLVLEPVDDVDTVELSEDAVVLEAAPAAPVVEPLEPMAIVPEAPAPAPAAPAPSVAPVEPPPAPGAGVGGEGTCRVVMVGKVKGKKKQKAAELMAYYQGITQEEALSQLSKTVVTMARDLTEEQAETCKSEFADIGVKVKLKK